MERKFADRRMLRTLTTAITFAAGIAFGLSLHAAHVTPRHEGSLASVLAPADFDVARSFTFAAEDPFSPPEALPASGDLSDRVDPARECVPGLVDSMCIYN